MSSCIDTTSDNASASDLWIEGLEQGSEDIISTHTQVFWVWFCRRLPRYVYQAIGSRSCKSLCFRTCFWRWRLCWWWLWRWWQALATLRGVQCCRAAFPCSASLQRCSFLCRWHTFAFRICRIHARCQGWTPIRACTSRCAHRRHRRSDQWCAVRRLVRIISWRGPSTRRCHARRSTNSSKHLLQFRDFALLEGCCRFIALSEDGAALNLLLETCLFNLLPSTLQI
mmetsp:Transcript_33656/g.53533  ORF Transcript_33656/g.53533 Transcript_33656/m.53533 type:complete len:226 (-) Transcript_33656:118-795(-)